MTGFHVLAKPTGAVCNLDCAYCFFLQKEDLYPGSSFRMTDEVLEAYLRQLVVAAAGDTVTVAWQGGEPTLMGIDFFRRADAIARSVLPAASGWSTRSRPTAPGSTTSCASCSGHSATSSV